ncbi:MAG: hypothetical protein RLY16_323 [Bacteroidota bacterium]
MINLQVMNFKKLFFSLIFFAGIILAVKAHDIHYDKIILKEWYLPKENKIIKGSFSFVKNEMVYIEDEKNNLIHVPLSTLSGNDQRYVKNRVRQIALLNQQSANFSNTTLSSNSISIQKIALIFCFLLALGFYTFKIAPTEKRKLLIPIFATGLIITLYGFTDKEIRNKILTTTNPTFVDSAFTAFKPKVYTHWDNTYFYVESKGIPDHQMMVGITSWQQQVPIPQCYTTANNNNAWSIPLNPTIAATPVPVNQQHFLRGAVAIAVNGVSIFNPYTNTGIDAFIDGQLDNYGGHSGRADDYHYHIAPLHLYQHTSSKLPIAFALDGFGIYGATEPDGSPMTALDANHGHYEANGRYHYHGTATAPYMIGNMVGSVTEDATMQIIPQAAARPVRPSLTPLTGAVITDFQTNANNNGYNLTYTRNGGTYQVNYEWADSTANSSKYSFHFVAPLSSFDTIYVGFSQSQCSVPTGIITTTYIKKSMLRLPDTGENTGYTSTPGEDADYNINTPFYISNIPGIVIDTVTGLMWQRTDGGEMTYENAVKYCDTLTLGGFTDWRLPNAHEGFSILNMQYSNPAIDTTVFTRTTADYWWTSNKQANDTTKIWATNAGGGVGNKPKNETISAGGSFRYHTRAVRDYDNLSSIEARFVNNLDGTTTDNFTGLTWQKIHSNDSLTWENALLYADTLSLANYTDWRMPNIKELQSINDELRIGPSIDTNYIRAINNKKYWSSTTLPNHTNEAWYLNARFGITSYDLKTAKDYVICVRGQGTTSISYIFNGNGNWNIASNWVNNVIPPANLPSGRNILIDPAVGGRCILNITQHILQGARIIVNNNKDLLILGELNLQ